MEDKDGFIKVRSRSKPNQDINKLNLINIEQYRMKYDKLLKVIGALCKQFTEESVLSIRLRLSSLQQTATDLPSCVSSIVCYGLGSPSSNHNSRWQVALLLRLHPQLQKPPVLLYDPVFCSQDCRLLKQYGFSVLTRNEECCRAAKSLTVFFMPYAGWEMFNNLLWSNWNYNELCNVVILGNDFRDLEALMTDAKLKKCYFYLHTALKRHMLNVWSVPNLTDTNIEFMNIAVTRFPAHLLPPRDDQVWQCTVKPRYLAGGELILDSNTKSSRDTDMEVLNQLDKLCL